MRSFASQVSVSLRGDFAICIGGHIGGLEALGAKWSAFDDLLAYIEVGFDFPAHSGSPKTQMPQKSALRIQPYQFQLARFPIRHQPACVHHQPPPGRWISFFG